MGRYAPVPAPDPNGPAAAGDAGGRDKSTPTVSMWHWLEACRGLGLSPQQGLISWLIRSEDLGALAIAQRLPKPKARRTARGSPGTARTEAERRARSVETQILRMCRKLTRRGPTEVRSRTAAVDRIWVEYLRLGRERPG